VGEFVASRTKENKKIRITIPTPGLKISAHQMTDRTITDVTNLIEKY
jgi:hypothetical protein